MNLTFRAFFAPVALVAVASISGAASAAVLTGSGPFLPLPASNPAWPIGIAPTYATVGLTHTGDWTGLGVHPDWDGVFGMSTPPIPSLSTGETRYDFTTLPLGYLPAGTYFAFGDVDGGSSNPERYDLQAFDSGGSPITTEWLDDTYAVNGSGTGGGGTILANDLPSWDWDVSNPDSYQLAASLSPTGNPSVTAVLQTNQPIWGLHLVKPTTHYGFNLLAPPEGFVPEPGTAALVAPAVVAAAWRRRRR